jgi:2-dehydropantoate 2-reductase
MRFVVLGAGAIGGSVGGRLAATGHDVLLVARGAHGAAIAERGIAIASPDGEITVRVPVVAHARDVAWSACDVVLLAVKTQDAAVALTELAAPFEVPIACMTNGVESERLAARRFDDVHAICVISPCDLREPGRIQQWGAPVRGVLDVGRHAGGHDVLDRRLAEAFTNAGYVSAPVADAMAWKRTKLLLNLANVVEALCGPGLREHELVVRAQQEARAVFAAAGLTCVSAAEDAARRALLRTGPVGGEPRRGGSTWQSLARGRTLETDYLNGEIVLLGRLHGVPTPVNLCLQQAAVEASRAQRAPGSLPVADLVERASVR